MRGWHQHGVCLAYRDAELERLRAELAAKGDDSQLLEDLQSQVAARETEIARLQGDLSSKVCSCLFLVAC